jgi:hypothetical protein
MIETNILTNNFSSIKKITTYHFIEVLMKRREKIKNRMLKGTYL